MKNNLIKNKKVVTGIVIIFVAFISAFSIKPKQAQALFGVGDITFTTVVADTSPTGLANNVAIWGTRLKDFVLDKLAYIAAKQILHQMTVSVVNWVNSGYEGKPAFLTNPNGFFLDAADQITGEFLAENGPLRRLCSPWSVDIRVALALKQMQTSYNGINSGRYTCTLSRVISSYRGANINGYSIDGFLDGDFQQGGWPAFIALTTERQNNPYGTYLQAYSDQLHAIQQKKGSIASDLSLGKGFLSWEECKDITENSGVSINDLADGNSDGSLRTGANGKYQKCETKTPGSVIAGTLEDQLGVPSQQLLLADSINEIAGAMITQLVSKTLQKGLHSLSSGGGGQGSGRAYLQQVYRDATSPRTVDASGANSSPNIQSLNIAKQRYDQALALLTDTRTRYEQARGCFINALGGSQASPTGVTSVSDGLNYVNTSSGAVPASKIQSIANQISLIEQAVNTNIVPTIGILSGVRTAIVNQINTAGSPTASLPGSTNLDTLARSIETQTTSYYSNFAALTLAAEDLATVVEKSAQDLATVQSDVQRYNSDAAAFQSFCNNM